MFEQFGNMELDTNEIFMVVWEWEQGTITLPSGLTDFGDTSKLKAVAIFFRNGSQVKVEGKNALAFREWWMAVHHPVGDVA